MARKMKTPEERYWSFLEKAVKKGRWYANGEAWLKKWAEGTGQAEETAERLGELKERQKENALAARKKKTLEIIEQFFGYIEQAMERGRWYDNGEAVIKERAKQLEEEEGEILERLENLRKEYEHSRNTDKK